MAGALDHALKIAFAVAKCGFSFATTFEHFLFNFILRIDWTHAAATAAPAGFEHQRISNGCGLCLDLCHIIPQHFGRGDHGHARLNGHAARTGFVPQLAHGLRFWTDKGDTGFGAGIDEVRVFGQQPITRMDGVGPAGLGHAQNSFDAKVRCNRAEALTNFISFICFETMEAEFVFFRINCNGALAQFIGRTHHPNSDFTTVGN